MTLRITLNYGTRQQFRYRCRDITLQGQVENAHYPLRSATFRLNGGSEHLFYVEALPDPGTDWVSAYKQSPAELRCKDQGDFTIEIPITDAALRDGENQLDIAVIDAQDSTAREQVSFTWDTRPLPLPLDLRDLRGYSQVQQIGQTVVGCFDLDVAQNVIRSRAPAYPDSLLVLGSPHGSQEATYAVRFLDFRGVKWLGPSDFHVGFEAKQPDIGIKTGWSTIGMMAINPPRGGKTAAPGSSGEARAFISWGDHSLRDQEWVVVTKPPVAFQAEQNVWYRVCHQVLREDGANRVRYRIWKVGEIEPTSWLCDETDRAIAAHLPRYDRGSFSLFQHSGMPIEWGDILVQAL